MGSPEPPLVAPSLRVLPAVPSSLPEGSAPVVPFESSLPRLVEPVPPLLVEPVDSRVPLVDAPALAVLLPLVAPGFALVSPPTPVSAPWQAIHTGANANTRPQWARREELARASKRGRAGVGNMVAVGVASLEAKRMIFFSPKGGARFSGLGGL